MKKALLGLALVSPVFFVDNAMSFPVNQNHSIEVEGNSVGRIRARSRVVDTGSSCQYTLQWTISTPPLSRTVRCDIRERKASNAFDCQQNAQEWVTTLISKTGTCYGFDEFGQQTRITTLTGGEHSSGVSGIFFASSVGDVQSFEIS